MKTDIFSHTVRALLGKVTLSAAAYHQLQVGDILLLEQECEKPLPLDVEGTALFEVSLGLVNTKKAVKIETVYERSDA